MKGIFFIIGLVICLVVFGLPILWCLMCILCVTLGVAVDAALTLGIFLTVALVAGIGIKVFFVDD